MASGVTLATASNSPQWSAASSEAKPFLMACVALNFSSRPGSTSTPPASVTPLMAAKCLACWLAMPPVPRMSSRIYLPLGVLLDPVFPAVEVGDERHIEHFLQSCRVPDRRLGLCACAHR